MKKVKPKISVHLPASKGRSTAVNTGMLPATLGAQAAGVVAAGGMLDHLR